MDRDSQHRTKTLTTRAHELTRVGRYALLLNTVNTTHNGLLLSARYTQKYVKSAVFGTVPTNTRANVHSPVILQPQPSRLHPVAPAIRPKRQQLRCISSICSGEGHRRAAPSLQARKATHISQ